MLEVITITERVFGRWSLIVGPLLVMNLLASGGCSTSSTLQETTPENVPGVTRSAEVEKLPEQKGLHNVLRLSDHILSGSEPEGEAGFDSLGRLGVKTVVSVDGAKPNVELAHQKGLRYVHIPIGYDGISVSAAQTLAQAARECESPIYIHCHHGKHRGPSAAAVADAAIGGRTGEAAFATLNAAGTGDQYAGLWRDVRAYQPDHPAGSSTKLVEVAEVGSLTAAMSQVDRHSDNLDLCRQANWNSPNDHPDLVPVQEALILKESLHEANRLITADREPDFVDWMNAAEQHAQVLEEALQANDRDNAMSAFAQLKQTCNQCHEKYRN